jgi:hypothetical protein
MTTDIFIDDFYAVADGDDWLPAFNRAQQLHGIANSAYASFGGFTLRFQAKAYFFSAAVQIICPMSLVGSGGVANPGTILMFPKGSKGLVFHGYGTNQFTKYGNAASQGVKTAQGSSVEKLMVLAVDPTDRRTPAETHAMTDFRESQITPNPGNHGITIYTLIALRDITVSRFDGHGIYIYGNGDDDATSPGTSSIAAFCQLTNVFISENGGDGLHLFGRDGSGSVIQSSQFVHNAGWGIRDLNYLGQTTFIGGQASYNISGGVGRPYNVVNRDYGTLVEQLNFMISSPYTSAEDRLIFTALADAVPNAIAMATPAPNVTDFPILLDPLQLHLANALYWSAYRNYCDAWEVHWKDIGDKLRAALLAAGFSPEANYSQFTHLDFGNPYGAGGDVFINVYGESNGVGDGYRNNLGLTNLAINCIGISNNTDSLGWSAAGFRHTLIGSLGVAASSIEVDSLALRIGSDVRTVSSSATAPTGAANPGTLVLNSNPISGGYIGWVSLGGGNWREFGAIA